MDTHDLHTFSELAQGTGRFEMEPTPHQGTTHYESLIGLAEAEAFGLFAAAEIRACATVSRSARHKQLLDALGVPEGIHWILRSPESESDRKLWSRVLKSDQVLIFTAPSERWLEDLVKQLHSPSVALFPSMSLSDAWLAYERSTFAELTNGVHVTLGAGRADITFVGAGKLYEDAVAYASLRPPLVWGYPPRAFRETLSSRGLIFPTPRVAG